MENVRHGMFFAHQGWYPDDPEACMRQVRRFLDEAARARAVTLPERLPGRAGVVPHAGWVFSGALAARVFDALSKRVGPVDTVVIFGGHLGPRSPGWVLTDGQWPTPLGDVQVDTPLAAALAEVTRLPAVGS